MWKKRQPHSVYKSTDTLIGHGGTLEGKVHCDTNLRIEGAFSGEIHCSGTVTVGEQGTVRSSIVAEEIIIAGKVYGNINAVGQTFMAGSGQLHGDLTTGTLTIMEGGLLNGSVIMKEQPAPNNKGGQQQDFNTDKKSTRSQKKQNAREAG